jgi:transcription initiation factor TFIID TATA-box-binding protein
MENPKVALLIFTSGKIVLAGAKCRKDVYTAYQKIYPVLFSFKKRNAAVVQLEDKKMK